MEKAPTVSPLMQELSAYIAGALKRKLPDAVAVRGWRCVMEITLKDGRRVSAQTMAAKGSPDNPLTRAEVTEKALDLMGAVLGTARGKTLIDALYDIGSVANVRSLRRLYAA